LTIIVHLLLFEPELSNLSIFTAAVGFKPSYKSSVDLLYHDYLQHRTSQDLWAVGLAPLLTGAAHAWAVRLDLILGYEEMHHVNLALALGYFIPGKPFPATSDPSFFIRLEMQLAF
jgi:alginate production protein